MSTYDQRGVLAEVMFKRLMADTKEVEQSLSEIQHVLKQLRGKKKSDDTVEDPLHILSDNDLLELKVITNAAPEMSAGEPGDGDVKNVPYNYVLATNMVNAGLDRYSKAQHFLETLRLNKPETPNQYASNSSVELERVLKLNAAKKKELLALFRQTFDNNFDMETFEKYQSEGVKGLEKLGFMMLEAGAIQLEMGFTLHAALSVRAKAVINDMKSNKVKGVMHAALRDVSAPDHTKIKNIRMADLNFFLKKYNSSEKIAAAYSEPSMFGFFRTKENESREAQRELLSGLFKLISLDTKLGYEEKVALVRGALLSVQEDIKTEGNWINSRLAAFVEDALEKMPGKKVISNDAALHAFREFVSEIKNQNAIFKHTDGGFTPLSFLEQDLITRITSPSVPRSVYNKNNSVKNVENREISFRHLKEYAGPYITSEDIKNACSEPGPLGVFKRKEHAHRQAQRELLAGIFKNLRNDTGQDFNTYNYAIMRGALLSIQDDILSENNFMNSRLLDFVKERLEEMPGKQIIDDKECLECFKRYAQDPKHYQAMFALDNKEALSPSQLELVQRVTRAAKRPGPTSKSD